MRNLIPSPVGQGILFVATFAFVMQLLCSVRHLVWDTVPGFSLSAIYLWGWIEVAASVIFTIAAWVASAFI
jgi:succinate dehydrogenase/fumarate reductase cytochrome b subunit